MCYLLFTISSALNQITIEETGVKEETRIKKKKTVSAIIQDLRTIHSTSVISRE